ncbi:MAG: ATP-dependent Clp protease adapter ClpS [Candidatus Binatia bacterium]
MPVRKPLHGKPDGDLATETTQRVKRPPLYRVVLLNDDYTPMEFVVWVLKVVFFKPDAEAVRLMLDVHNKGKGSCGVFPHDTACTKAAQVKRFARQHEHPLECLLEATGGDEGGDGER